MASELPSFSPTAFEYSQSPNPSFKFGQKVDATDSGRKWLEGEKRGWTVVDANHEDPKLVHLVSLTFSNCYWLANILGNWYLKLATMCRSGYWHALPVYLDDQRNHTTSCCFRVIDICRWNWELGPFQVRMTHWISIDLFISPPGSWFNMVNREDNIICIYRVLITHVPTGLCLPTTRFNLGYHYATRERYRFEYPRN